MYQGKKELRSRQAIKAALIALVRTTPYSKITVQNIIDRSQYSKGTFYSHFSDKDDLLKQMIDDEVSRYVYYTTTRVLEQKDMQHTIAEIRNSIVLGLEDFFFHVYQNQEFYRCIAAHSFPGVTFNTLAQMNYEKVSLMFTLTAQPPYEKLDMDMYLHQCCHTYMQYVKYWVDHEFAQSPKYMVEQAVMLLRTSIPIRVEKQNVKNDCKIQNR